MDITGPYHDVWVVGYSPLPILSNRSGIRVGYVKQEMRIHLDLEDPVTTAQFEAQEEVVRKSLELEGWKHVSVRLISASYNVKNEEDGDIERKDSFVIGGL